MTREEVMKTLNEIFCNVFDDESIVLTDETNANDIEYWQLILFFLFFHYSHLYFKKPTSAFPFTTFLLS